MYKKLKNYDFYFMKRESSPINVFSRVSVQIFGRMSQLWHTPTYIEHIVKKFFVGFSQRIP